MGFLLLIFFLKTDLKNRITLFILKSPPPITFPALAVTFLNFLPAE